MQIIYGKNPVVELLSSSPKTIEKIQFSTTVRREKIKKILELCKTHSIRFDFVPIEKLNSVLKEFTRDENKRDKENNTNNSFKKNKSRENTEKKDDQTREKINHQGIIAYISPFKYSQLEKLDYSNDNSKIIILDNIEDPHNLGAIIRTAVATGIEAVIIPDRNSATVNDTVIKTSSGTVFNIPVVKVKNITNTINFLKEKEYFVVGTDVEKGLDYRKYNFTGKRAIVIGNEGKGIRRLVKDNCDDLVYIPLSNGVESLNASVAAALLMFEVVR